MRKIKENTQQFNSFQNFRYLISFNREFCKLHEFQLIYTKSRKPEEEFCRLSLKLLNIFESSEKILESKYETIFGKLIAN